MRKFEIINQAYEGKVVVSYDEHGLVAIDFSEAAITAEQRRAAIGKLSVRLDEFFKI